MKARLDTGKITAQIFLTPETPAEKKALRELLDLNIRQCHPGFEYGSPDVRLFLQPAGSSD